MIEVGCDLDSKLCNALINGNWRLELNEMVSMSASDHCGRPILPFRAGTCITSVDFSTSNSFNFQYTGHLSMYFVATGFLNSRLDCFL